MSLITHGDLINVVFYMAGCERDRGISPIFDDGARASISQSARASLSIVVDVFLSRHFRVGKYALLFFG